MALGTIAAVAVLFYLISLLRPYRGSPMFEPTPTSAFATDHASFENAVDRALRGAYVNQPDSVFRYVDGFWFEGGVFGWIDDKADDALYVAFRGTSELGNWFLTNAQAHMVQAHDVLGAGARGGVHQGFVKAFIDLWLPDNSPSPHPERREPAVRVVAPDPPANDEHCARHATDRKLNAVRSYGLTKWFLAPLWSLVLAVPIYIALHMAHGQRWPWTLVGPPSDFSQWEYGDLMLLTCVLVLAAQLLFAYGHFEGFFRRGDKLVLGPPLKHVVQTKAAKTGKRIVFTGHSLGGALATLAFADYLTVAPNDQDIALITFGAPQVGDDAFGKWLRDLPRARDPERTSVSIVGGIGDPVPHLPPRSTFLQAAIRSATPLGSTLAAVYTVGWLPYALCYRALLGPEWNSIVLWLGSPGLTSSKHFDTYTDLEEVLQRFSSRGRPTSGGETARLPAPKSSSNQ